MKVTGRAVYKGRVKQGRRSRSWPMARLMSLAVILGLAFLPEAARAVRPQRTVFHTQPVEWNPEVDEDHKPPALVFQPSWTWNGFKAPLAGDPVLCAGSIVAASRDGDVVAIVPSTGEIRWRASLAEAVTVGPATDGTLVFQVSARGRLRALQGLDGQPAWSIDLPETTAVPIRVIGGRVLVGTVDGVLVSVDARSGRIAARQTLPGRPSTAPEAAPGTLLIGTDHGFVMALDDSTLETRWKHAVGPAVTSPPVFHDGRVYFAAADRTIRCLRFRSGRQRWRARLGAVSTARPIALTPYLYVLCYDNDIYVLNGRNGHQLTRVRLGHRLDSDPLMTEDHLMVVPFTEASVVGLALPKLETVGRYALEAPGEWFTTSPLWIDDQIAVGYGRSEGRILALKVSRQKPEPAGSGSPSGEPRQPGS